MELDGARVKKFFLYLEGVATFPNDHLQVSPVPGCWESSSYWKDERSKIYWMKLWAKSKFWYILRKLKKVKKSVFAINEIFEKKSNQD